GFLMKRSIVPALGLAAAAAFALPLFAAPAPPADSLALIPGDALAVGQVRVDRLKSTATSAGIFHETDAVTADGKASKFLHDAGLDPKRDVASAIFSLTASASGHETAPLVVFEGRFDPAALASATVARGATRVDAAPVPYYRLPKDNGEN